VRLTGGGDVSLNSILREMLRVAGIGGNGFYGVLKVIG
jgi:hypothetical protein